MSTKWLICFILYIYFYSYGTAKSIETIQSTILKKQLNLQMNQHNLTLSIGPNLTQIQLTCTFGNHWILPSNAKLIQNSVELQQSVHKTGSQLLINLDPNRLDRLRLRGLYQCCYVNESDPTNMQLEFRTQEPSCCPCCPWYEQQACSFQWNHKLHRFAISQNLTHCSSLFLYTNQIPDDFVQLQIVRDEPSLIPCPAPIEPEFGTKFRIDYEIIPSPFARQSWFPFDQDINSQIKHVYDPRFGLCLFESEFPRPVYVFKCTYLSHGLERQIQPIWPPPSPAIKPYVKLEFDKFNHTDNRTLSVNQINLTKIYMEFNQETNPIPSLYRLPNRTQVKARCIATYMDHRIVLQPPWSLCFQWHIGPYPVKIENLFLLPTIYSSDFWNFTNCQPLQTVTINQTIQPFVLALDEINLPRLVHNLSIICRVLPQSRKSPFGQQMTHLIVVDPKKIQLSTSVKTNLTTDGYLKRLWFNQSKLIDPYSNLTESYAIFYQLQPIQLKITFWTLDEFGNEPFCQPVCLFPNQCSFKFDHIIIKRQGNHWICFINLTDNSLVIPSITTHTINLTIGLGQLLKQYRLVILNHTKLFKPHITGLHGNVHKPIRLGCNSESIEIPIWKQLNLHIQPIQIGWQLEWDNKLENQTNLKLISDLLIPSIYDQFKDPFIEFEQLENGTYRTISNRGRDEQWTREQWPRQLCASCQVVYDNSSIISIGKSEKQCQTLTSNLLKNNPNQLNVILYSRFQNWNNTIPLGLNDINETISIVKGSQIELYCAVPNLLHQSWQQIIIYKSWPNIDEHHKSFLGNKFDKTVQITPYSKVMMMKLSNTDKMDPRTDYTCHYTNQTLTFGLQLVDPIKPRILEPQQFYKLFEQGSLVELKCLAFGIPQPMIEWKRLTKVNSTQPSVGQWIVLKQCLPWNLSSQNQNYTSCIYPIQTFTDDQQIIVQCHVHNPVGTISINLTLTSLTFHRETTDETLKSDHHLFWITVILLPILILILLITTLICFKLRKMNIYSNLVHIQNLLYRKPYLGTYSTETNPVLLDVFDSIEDVIRFTIPRDSCQITPITLGLGHYGQVRKGWLDWTYTNPSSLHQSIHDKHKIAVAVKTCSGELISLKCLQNEISLLSRLTHCPNVVKMYGLIVGQHSNLVDTSLIMEYCHQKSLNEFIRKNAYQLKIRYLTNVLTNYKMDSIDSGISDTKDGDKNSDLIEQDNEIEQNSIPTWGYLKSSPTNDFKFEIQDLYSISFGIVNGIEYLAKNQIIHRDLATRNILLTNEMTPKICDFGLAVRFTASSTNRTDNNNNNNNNNNNDNDYCNTDPNEKFYRIISFTKQLPFRILPPEALQDQLFYFASDIWQLGLLLWQLFHLEYKKPFDSIKTVDQLCDVLKTNQINHWTNKNQILYGYLDKPQLMLTSLWDMVCRMWSFNHEQRPNATEIRYFIQTLIETTSDWDQELTTVQYKSITSPYLSIPTPSNQYDLTTPREQDEQSVFQHNYINQVSLAHQQIQVLCDQIE